MLRLNVTASPWEVKKVKVALEMTKWLVSLEVVLEIILR